MMSGTKRKFSGTATAVALAIYAAGSASALADDGMAHDQYRQSQAQQNQNSSKGSERRDTSASTQQAPALVIGKVTDMRNVNVQEKNGDERASHRVLKIEQQNGQTMIVDAGVVGATSTPGLATGDRVIAVGRAGRINGEPVVFARALGELYSTGMVGTNDMASSRQLPEKKTQQKRMEKSSGTTGVMPTAQREDRSKSSPHNRVASNAGEPTNILVVGDIAAARDVKLAATAGDQHRLLRVKTDSGQQMVVDVGVPLVVRVPHGLHVRVAPLVAQVSPRASLKLAAVAAPSTSVER